MTELVLLAICLGPSLAFGLAVWFRRDPVPRVSPWEIVLRLQTKVLTERHERMRLEAAASLLVGGKVR